MVIRGLFHLIVPIALTVLPLQAQERWPDPDPEILERAKALLREVPLIDGHNDLATTLVRVVDGDLSRTDLTRLQPELSADLPRLR